MISAMIPSRPGSSPLSCIVDRFTIQVPPSPAMGGAVWIGPRGGPFAPEAEERWRGQLAADSTPARVHPLAGGGSLPPLSSRAGATPNGLRLGSCEWWQPKLTISTVGMPDMARRHTRWPDCTLEHKRYLSSVLR